MTENILAAMGIAEVSDSWAVLEAHGFPPEAVGWPARNIAGLLPEAIEAAISTLIRQREDLLAEVLQLRPAIQPQRMPVSMTELANVIYDAGTRGTNGVAEAILKAYSVTRPECGGID